MSDKTAPWFGKVMWELIKRQPGRYALAQTLWITIWSMQIIVGIIIARYFDALTEGITATQLVSVVAAMFAYAAGRSVIIFFGMRNHASLLFRAGALMRRNLLGRIYELPGAAALLVAEHEELTAGALEFAGFSLDLLAELGDGDRLVHDPAALRGQAIDLKTRQHERRDERRRGDEVAQEQQRDERPASRPSSQPPVRHPRGYSGQSEG